MSVWSWAKSKIFQKQFPRELETFFSHGECPDCGGTKFYQSQDGGHDVLLECSKCGSKFGIQESPFNLIERVGSK
jgi:transcription elongation factor Elf1